MKATTIRMDDTVLDRVDSMAKSVNRSRTWVINQAVERFLSYEEWFVQEVQSGIDEVANGEIASREKVEERFAKWDVNAD
ncbi:MAG: ribbon-helix-helix protein, CopG family [Desulfobulbaceae bacterium]|nr:ribbon-helix-helix protein, CopG family [Desulfobulbaceae bacterium]